jgi:hypothetical protein
MVREDGVSTVGTDETVTGGGCNRADGGGGSANEGEDDWMIRGAKSVGLAWLI